MEIVINASPLILLSKIDRLYLLNKLFHTVYIPLAVLQEIQAIGKTDVQVNLSDISFKELEVTNRIAVLGLLGRLHMGEVEVMVGAIENGISKVVLDENSARNKAKQLGLEVTGTLGILLKAKKCGFIDNIREEVEKLKNAGMYLSDKIIEQLLLE